MQIHLEGLDLAGKSTLCRALSEALPDAKIRHNCLAEDNPLYQQADAIRLKGEMPDEPLGWLYYGALLADLDAWTPRTDSIIQDSTILLRSCAFHEVKGNFDLAARFRSLLARHPGFDRSFVLVSDRDTRLKRLEGRISRGNEANDDFLVRDDPAKFFAMEKILVDTAVTWFDAEVIDTSRLEDQQERKRIIEHILAASSEAASGRKGRYPWQAAAKIAASAHRHQLRRDKRTPYIAHPVRVMLTLRELFGVGDPDVLCGALLHDVIEDTDTDYDDVMAGCGKSVADMVAALSKDCRKIESVREEEYFADLKKADWRVKLIKMADVCDNFFDSIESGNQKESSKANVEKMISIAEGEPRLERACAFLKGIIS